MVRASNGAIIALHPQSSITTNTVDINRLVAAFLSGKREKTIKAYRCDLETFQSFIGANDLNSAVYMLLSNGNGAANTLALEYRSRMIEQGLAPASINRRMAALRSLVRLATTLGVVQWSLDVKNVKVTSYRDTRGPGRNAVSQILELLNRKDAPKTKRDKAIIRCLYDLALRRSEVIGLDVEDLDLTAGTVAILGKGQTQKILLTLPEPTKQAIYEWLNIRGVEKGPLFINMDRAKKGHCLTTTSLYRIVRDLGLKIGLTIRPHGLRHSAITAALDSTNGDVRAVQKFSRHKDLRVLNTYDDSRVDLAGKVAKIVAAGI